MLDQNTDRMWYVIGAVLIGAAIIFGMNTLMPNAFASVGNLFSEQTEKVSDKVSSIGVKINPNLLGDGNSDNWRTYSAGEVGFNTHSFLSIADMGLSSGDEITFSGQYDFGDDRYAPRIMFTLEDYEPN